MPRNKFLLVSRTGRKGLWRSWLGAPEARNFDVFLSAYDPAVELPQEEGVYTELRPGKKVEGYAGVMQERRALLDQYDYIAFFDDDLKSTPETISRLFSICAEYDIKIGQPALSQDSYFTYASLLAQRDFKLRYVTYVEMMCPVFRRDVLWDIAPLFSLGYESGIDLIWCNLVYEGPKDFAVIDETPVLHTEPVGHAKALNGFTADRTYEDDIYRILADFSLPWLPNIPYGAVKKDGAEVEGKAALLLSAMTVAPSIWRRKRLQSRLRSFLVHINHLASKKPANISADWPEAYKPQ